MTTVVERNPRVTVKISGGLGNQMFQYAAGRAMAVRTGAQLELDVTFYRSRRHRNLELNAFPIAADAVSSRGTVGRFLQKLHGPANAYREPHFQYDRHLETVSPPVTLDGYFQTERYFADQATVIRKDLCCPAPSDQATRDVGKKIADSGAASLHVRRGDYVTNKNASETFCVCTMDYYRRAMERIPGDDDVYVFSDDPRWAKDNLPPVKKLVFADPSQRRSGLDDLWLMTHARHHIIANSTFSWWGAWLADSADGLTIAPTDWFIDAETDDSDLIPTDWIRI